MNVTKEGKAAVAWRRPEWVKAALASGTRCVAFTVEGRRNKGGSEVRDSLRDNGIHQPAKPSTFWVIMSITTPTSASHTSCLPASARSARHLQLHVLVPTNLNPHLIADKRHPGSVRRTGPGTPSPPSSEDRIHTPAHTSGGSSASCQQDDGFRVRGANTDQELPIATTWLPSRMTALLEEMEPAVPVPAGQATPPPPYTTHGSKLYQAS